jgi:hypothetical protein
LQSSRVIMRNEEPRSAFFDELRHAPDVCGDNREPLSHRLEHHIRKRFGAGR